MLPFPAPNNVAIVTIGKGRAVVQCMARSSVESKKDDLARTLQSVFGLVGARVTLSGAYPGWNPATSSPMLAILKDVYQRRFHTPPKIVATHGGLECGLIRAVYPHMDAVSIGPTIRAPHSPDEHVDIRSVQKFWDFLVDALARVPKKAAQA